MKRPRLSRWVGSLVLTLALAATTASGQDDTLTISGTFTGGAVTGTVGADLAGVSGTNTWSLTLYGTSYSHERFDSQWGSHLYTYVHATSFDFQFEGPDADVLNDVVSQYLVKGGAGRGAFLALGNSDAGSRWAQWWVALQPADPANGVSFGASHDVDGFIPWFPSDEDGYPVLGSEPLSLQAGASYITDNRSGNSGSLESWYDIVDIEGGMGSPHPATVSIGDGSALEGNRGSSKLNLSVTLANQSDQAITVNYRTIDGTAISGGGKKANADYGAATGTVTFQPGETRKSITIAIKPDRTAEADEVFYVELFNAVGTTIVDGDAAATIRNDD